MNLKSAAIVANTRVGHAEAWQQRWLDYRQLAERLRPMRSLKLLAVARPPVVSASSRTGTRRWIDWYAGAIWRQVLAVLYAYGAFLAVLCSAVWLRRRCW